MFFEHKVLRKLGNKAVHLNQAKLCSVDLKNTFVSEYLKEICDSDAAKENEIVCDTIWLKLGIPDEIKNQINSELNENYVFHEEAYCLEVGKNTTIYGESERAILYAITTLKQLMSEGQLTELFLFDYPTVDLRGFHVFIPGRHQLASFKEMIDNILVGYKYNAIIFEVGGAMEYKRHPVINKTWEEYCELLLSDSGIGDKIQHYTYPWAKNAIHPENGGGSYLTQEELKELIRYCKDRGMDVIPEIPSLSHSDYIVRAYPEINERVEDKDPDTYCPSNPKTYEIMYDIIDEVAEVFEGTRYIAIGHDELVTIGVCEKCKSRDPKELFISDIVKLSSYIKGKGCRTLMYGDKFTKYLDKEGKPFIDPKGKPCGGCQGYEKNDIRYVPELYSALEKLPKDIIIADWFWWTGPEGFDKNFTEHDVFFANFEGRSFKNWKKRFFKPNVKGVWLSNWGRNDYINMQRNNIIPDLIFNAGMCWSESYDSDQCLILLEKAMLEANAYYRRFILKQKENKKYIEICHHTDYFVPHTYFYDGDFVKEEDYHIGNYLITYNDGTIAKEPVIYGKNIASKKLNPKEYTDELLNVTGATVAELCGDEMYYRWIFENPCPDKEISDISFEAQEGFDCRVTRKEINY